MIDLTIDTLDLSSEFNLNQDDIDSLMESTVKRVTQAFARHWDTVAKQSLGSTRDIYRNAIQVIDLTDEQVNDIFTQAENINI